MAAVWNSSPVSMLLSIAGGTIVYMILIRVVF